MVNRENKELDGQKVIAVLIISILAIIFILDLFYIIPAGNRGVLMTFGKPSMDAKGEGLHIKVPLLQSVAKMEIKTQKYEADLTAASKDLQDVKTKIAINYHLLDTEVPKIYRDIGKNYADKLIQPLEQETNKEVTAKYTAEELITRRSEVRGQMKDKLIEKLRDRGIIVEEVSIVNFEFSPSFTLAIEAKVTAEQSALTARNKLEQVKFEASQKIEEAKGKAEAINIEGMALRQNPQIIGLKFLEKWDGILPKVTGGSIPFFDVNQFMGS